VVVVGLVAATAAGCMDVATVIAWVAAAFNAGYQQPTSVVDRPNLLRMVIILLIY
jgi:hypothetical protein